MLIRKYLTARVLLDLTEVKPNWVPISSAKSWLQFYKHWQNKDNLHRPEECPSFHPLLDGCNP